MTPRAKLSAATPLPVSTAPSHLRPPTPAFDMAMLTGKATPAASPVPPQGPAPAPTLPAVAETQRSIGAEPTPVMVSTTALVSPTATNSPLASAPVVTAAGMPSSDAQAASAHQGSEQNEERDEPVAVDPETWAVDGSMPTTVAPLPQPPAAPPPPSVPAVRPDAVLAPAILQTSVASKGRAPNQPVTSKTGTTIDRGFGQPTLPHAPAAQTANPVPVSPQMPDTDKPPNPGPDGRTELVLEQRIDLSSTADTSVSVTTNAAAAPPLAPTPLTTISPTPTLAPATPLTVDSDGAWIDRLASEIAASGRGGVSQFRLSPDSLGGMTVAVRMEGDTAHIAIAADRASGHALLAAAQDRLLAEAKANGVRVGDVQLSLHFDPGRPDPGSSQTFDHRHTPRAAPQHEVPPKRTIRIDVDNQVEAHRSGRWA